MDLNRRRRPRIVPEEFIFIQVQQDDGGHVLNVSEEGLCFQVFSTIFVTQLVHFWFSFNLRDRIEARGRLVWMDTSKGVGGLSFVDLNQAAREQIRSWMDRMPAVERAGEEKSLTTGSSQEDSATHSAVSPPEATPKRPDVTELVPLKRHLFVARLRFIWGLLLGVAVSFAVGTLFSNHGLSSQNASDPAIRRDLEGRPGSQDTKSAAPDIGPASVVAPAAMKSRRSELPNPSLADPVDPPREQHHSSQAKKMSATPAQLWAAVQAGNTKAAVSLADLYTHGDGVPVNCDQARVLLFVASEKNNAEAIKKLRDLDKTGCPAP